MKALITFLILITTIDVASAQVLQEWIAIYSTQLDEEANSIAVDDSGNVFVTGYSYGNEADYATVKYNSSGVQQWVAKYEDHGNDYACSIALDDSGNVFVTGYSIGNRSNYDYATIKYNSSGVLKWVVKYVGPGNDYAYSIAVDDSSNVFVTGMSYGSGTGYDYATIKYNSSGVVQWIERYNNLTTNNSYDAAYQVKLDDSGNVYVTGMSSGNGTQYDYATVKYNSSGIQQWIMRYDCAGFYDEPASMVVDGSGNVFVTGESRDSGGHTGYATIKYNSSGVQQWAARYSDGVAKSITLDDSGNVYVTGLGYTDESSGDYVTIKYNSSGYQLWIARYHGPGNYYDIAHSIAVDRSGGVFVTGQSVGSGGDYDYATIKYNSFGAQQWIARYNGPGNDYDNANSIALDRSGNVYVTGRSYGSGTGFDYATIKYSQPTGINQISSMIQTDFNLSQNYPNPFNPTTSIEFSLPEKSQVKLKVFDITGKEVAELVNENLPAGIFRYEFNAVHLSSGLYLYKLETEKFSETKRMIVLK